jgi:uncharacterized membrane protein
MTKSRLMRTFLSRPRLLEAIGLGLLVGVLLSFRPGGMAVSTRAILAWDSGCLTFITAMMLLMRRQTEHSMRRRAAEQDEGQMAILSLVLLAATASIGAVALELSAAKTLHGLDKGLRVGLAFLTVTLSWFLVQLIFALHYAHEYFRTPDPAQPEVYARGLAFPEGEVPDFWDFLHFSIVIGVASQTADIGFVSRSMRRTGTVHCVIAFVFNTAVLALGINLVAGLF